MQLYPLTTDDYDRLASDIINLHASIHAASYRLLGLIREFDDLGLARQNGFISTAHWLGFYLGLGPNAAREKVRVAKALSSLPLIDRAFAAGELSYSKARAVTRVAHEGNEERLLRFARAATAHQVERFVRDQVRIRKGRAPVSTRPELTWLEADNGDLVFKGRLPAELGALLIKAVEQRMEGHSRFDPEVADSEPLAARRAQALIEVAEASLAHEDTPQSSADRYLVHIDHDDPSLSEAARARLTCDASVVIHQGGEHGETLDLGRRTRTIPPAIRRALRRRDKGCRYPGCTHTRFVDAHHVHHWANGGETKLDNLVLLCRRHHVLIHDGRASIEVSKPARGATQFHFLDAQGRRILPTGDSCLATANITVLEPERVANVTAEIV